MSEISILYLSPGDNQQVLVDKINQNFSSISGSGGGVRGPKGDQGPRGPVGQQGPKGDPGSEGQRGTRWYFQSTDPAIDPLNVILGGDYWSDTNTDNLVYVYTSSGWVSTGNFLKSEDPFKTITGVAGPTLSNAVVFSSSTPFSNTLVISDVNVTAVDANPNYSKVLISTNSSSGTPILEFSKSNLQDGSAIDANKHPRFSWKNPLLNDYALQLSVPSDNLTIESGGNISLVASNGTVEASGANVIFSASSSATISSLGPLTLQSGAASNILVSSANFDLTSTLASFSVPVMVSPASNSTALSINNSTGEGLSVEYAGSTPSTATLINLKSGGSTQFYVKGDGKVFTKRIVSTYSVSSQTGASATTIFVSSGAGLNFYSVGTNIFNTGNTIIVPFYSKQGGAGSEVGVYLPLGPSLAGTFASYIDVGESIEFDVLSPDNTTLMTRFGASIGGGVLAASAAFTGCTKIKVTLMRVSSGTTINDWRVYYSTPTAAGKL